MRWKTTAIILLVSAAGSVVVPPFEQAARADDTPAKACAEGSEPSEEGSASWYGRPHQGKKTANGERFDANAPTAAHPDLPLGTEIEVTNLENGRETTLTVTDRGPKAKDRVLDVSKKGAQELGFVKDGTAQVRIEPKGKPC
jgi:rare lipoprotein A